MEQKGSEIVLNWVVQTAKRYTFIHFAFDGLLVPSDLRRISLPAIPEGGRKKGLIISGRGPVWLYAFLVHEAHPFAWVAVFDPRLGGGVVVENHLPDGPNVGDIIEHPFEQN